MRLLRPSELKERADFRAKNEQLLLQKAQEELAQTLSSLNQAREGYEQERNRLETDLYAYENHVKETKAGLLRDILSLETRKREAEKPANERKQELLALETRIEEQKQVVTSMAQKVGEGKAELAAFKALLIDKESEVVRLETEIATRLNGLRDAESLNRKSTNDLALQWSEFHKNRAAFEEEKEKFGRELRLEQASVQKDKIWVEEQKKAMDEERKHIESQQETLRLAFVEARSKNLL